MYFVFHLIYWSEKFIINSIIKLKKCTQQLTLDSEWGYIRWGYPVMSRKTYRTFAFNGKVSV